MFGSRAPFSLKGTSLGEVKRAFNIEWKEGSNKKPRKEVSYQIFSNQS